MKVVFFDRDGVVNVSPGIGKYVESASGFILTPGFADVLRAVTERGYQAVIVTNQRCVTRGIVSLEDLDGIHSHMKDLLSKEGLELLDVIFCPHGDDDACNCRKPKPGMLLEAREKHDIDMNSSWMVGDGERDIEAGISAECKTVRITEEQEETKADHKVDNMEQLKELVEKEF